MPAIKLYIKKAVSFDGEEIFDFDGVEEIVMEKWGVDDEYMTAEETWKNKLVFVGDNVLWYGTVVPIGDIIYGFGHWYDNGTSIVITIYTDRLKIAYPLIEALSNTNLLSNAHVEFGIAECECECS